MPAVSPTQRPSLWRRIGPAFIVGAVIIGPGSVTLMSRTGALYGYSMVWLSLLSGALMAGFIALFMRFGIYCEDTFLGLAGRKLGRWFAVLCGISLFSVNATFQFGNNLGVTAGMEALFGHVPQGVWPIVFTTAAIAFMFSLKEIYRVVEKMMTVFLVVMFWAFLINLIWARPDLPAALKGACLPRIPKGADWVTLGGLVATTFVIVAAFFQSYLVKAKGWHEEDLASGATDTVLASIIYTLIGTVIMMTAAAVVYPHAGEVTFETMVEQLEGVFGRYAKIIFCIGFWSAAFSSFVTNSLIGGVLLNDGLGLGGRLDSIPTKICATLVLLIGMTTAIAIIQLKPEPAPLPETIAQTELEREARPAAQRDLKVTAIAIGQAATMLAVPFGAIAMVVVLFDKRATRGRDLPIWTKGLVLFGAAILLGIAAMMFYKIRPELAKLLGLG